MTRAVSAWSAACLAGLLGLVTATLWRDERRAELVSMVGKDVPAPERDQAITLLIVGTFVALGLVLALATALTARLPRAGLPARVVLTLLAVVQALLVPAAVPILTAAQWEGKVTTALLVGQVVLAVAGTVLMWLPGSRRH